MDIEREIKRLRVRTGVLTFIVIAGILAYGWGKFEAYMESTRKLSFYAGTQPLKLSAWSDGPFVITHVAAYGQSSSESRWAALPEPMVVMDSTGGYIDLTKLRWRNVLYEDADAPTTQRIELFYFRPEKSKPKSEPHR